MFATLIKIIPLDLAATLSPGILALTLILLGNKNYPKIRTLSLLVGTLIVAAAIIFAGLFLADATPAATGPTLISTIIDLILGLVFVYFGLKQIRSKDRKLNEHESAQGYQILRWLVIGILISATNFDAVLLSLAAAKEVGDAAIDSISKIILMTINALFFVAPTALPLILYLIFPRFAAKSLGKLNAVVFKYSRYILMIMFLIFGLYFLCRGIKYFI